MVAHIFLPSFFLLSSVCIHYTWTFKFGQIISSKLFVKTLALNSSMLRLYATPCSIYYVTFYILLNIILWYIRVWWRKKALSISVPFFLSRKGSALEATNSQLILEHSFYEKRKNRIHVIIELIQAGHCSAKANLYIIIIIQSTITVHIPSTRQGLK